MKYLNTQDEFLNENADSETSIKEILYDGLSRVANTSHLVSEQIIDNIDLFMEDLNVGLLTEAVGEITGVLGHGMFGAVFSLGDDKALKFTFDYREAPFLYEYGLKNRTKGIVKVDKVFKIKFGNTFAYLIVRNQLKFIKNDRLINSVMSDLKRNGVTEKTTKKYKDAGGLEYKIFLALKSMYDMDPNWRGTWYTNIAKQKGQIVLYDGFSKNIKLDDSEIPMLNISNSVAESMVHKRSLDQLKKVRKMMKGIDIGDRIADESLPNSTSHHNVNDVHIQSYEEYMDEPFEVNQNVKNFKAKK